MNGVALDAERLADELPDVPEQVETRWLLRAAASRLLTDAGGAVVVAAHLPSGAVIGEPGPGLLRQAMKGAPRDIDFVAQPGVARRLARELEGWRLEEATLHLPEEVIAAEPVEGSGVTVAAPAGPGLVAELPSGEDRLYAKTARAISVSREGGEVVSWCQAAQWTETLWDVGIDTLEGHRRRGHASACFRALAAHLACEGRQPVWGAADGNAASLGMARELGFVPSGRVAVLTPPARST